MIVVVVVVVAFLVAATDAVVAVAFAIASAMTLPTLVCMYAHCRCFVFLCHRCVVDDTDDDSARCCLLHFLISTKALKNKILPHAFLNRGDAKATFRGSKSRLPFKNKFLERD